jgi:peptidoglycan/LPS O-acetylase OafA/YrhL
MVVSCSVALRELRSLNRFLNANPIKAILRIFARTGDGSYTIYVLHYPLLLLLAGSDVKLGVATAAMLTIVILSPKFERTLSRSVAQLSFFRDIPAREQTR